MIHERRLGRTGLSVSEVGYGAWGIGGDMWLGAQDDESLAALNRAIDLGLNFIDTALAYGRGHSEQLVGQVVRSREERIVVSSKIPPKNLRWPAPDGIDPDEAFPEDWVRKCTERTLSNLGMDALDIQQFHVWNDDWLGRGTWLQAIEALKDEGKIRFFGVSINDLQPGNAVKLVETGVVDTVQVIYNVFEQAPEDELLGACEAYDVGVIARVPFDEGSLTGTLTADSKWPDGDFRNLYFNREQLAATLPRVDRLRPLVPEGMDLPELALRFILEHPAVSTTIPGMRQPRNVERNLAASDGTRLPPRLHDALKGHRWDRVPNATP